MLHARPYSFQIQLRLAPACRLTSGARRAQTLATGTLSFTAALKLGRLLKRTMKIEAVTYLSDRSLPMRRQRAVLRQAHALPSVLWQS